MSRVNSNLHVVGTAIKATLDAEARKNLHAQHVQRVRTELLAVFTQGGSSRSSQANRRRWVRRALYGAVCGACALMGAWWQHPELIAFKVEHAAIGARAELGDVIEASSAAAEIRFTEGSAVALAPKTRVRILSRARDDVRILLESGDLTLRARDGVWTSPNWTIEAGSFRVRAADANCRIAWDVSSGRLSLLVVEGSATVSALCLGSARQVNAGQSVELSCAADRALSGPLTWCKVTGDSEQSSGLCSEAPAHSLDGPEPSYAAHVLEQQYAWDRSFLPQMN